MRERERECCGDAVTNEGFTIATPHPVNVVHVNTNLALQSSEANLKVDCEPGMHTRQTLASLLRIGITIQVSWSHVY